jgi:galactonate dehydratase
MKITGANIYLVRIGTLHPILVELFTDEGLSGIGEAAVAYGIGGTSAAGVVKDLLESLVLGRDPFRIEELWADTYDHSFWAKGGGTAISAGVSTIEQALWDIKGKALGISVYELLGGKLRDEVRVYANGWSYTCVTAADYARAAELPLPDGHTALKCYPLAIPNENGGIRHVSRRSVDKAFIHLTFENVKVWRHAVGTSVDIMLDLSGGLTTNETIRLCRRLEELDIFFTEEPADRFDAGALTKISSHVNIPIAVGERAYTRNDFRPILESRSVDILQPDIGSTGGITEAKKIAAMAEAFSMRIQPHVCASPASTATALQLDARIANVVIQEIYSYRPEAHFQIVDHAPQWDIKHGSIPRPPWLRRQLAGGSCPSPSVGAMFARRASNTFGRSPCHLEVRLTQFEGLVASINGSTNEAAD